MPATCVTDLLLSYLVRPSSIHTSNHRWDFFLPIFGRVEPPIGASIPLTQPKTPPPPPPYERAWLVTRSFATGGWRRCWCRYQGPIVRKTRHPVALRSMMEKAHYGRQYLPPMIPSLSERRLLCLKGATASRDVRSSLTTRSSSRMLFRRTRCY